MGERSTGLKNSHKNKYTDIAESINKELHPQYRVILKDTDVSPLNEEL